MKKRTAKIIKSKGHGYLCDYKTGEAIRAATKLEAQASRAAAKVDGGAGIIMVHDRPCFVG